MNGQYFLQDRVPDPAYKICGKNAKYIFSRFVFLILPYKIKFVQIVNTEKLIGMGD